MVIVCRLENSSSIYTLRYARLDPNEKQSFILGQKLTSERGDRPSGAFHVSVIIGAPPSTYSMYLASHNHPLSA